MTDIQKTCYAVIDQLSLMYTDKDELKNEVSKLGYTPVLKKKLLDFLDREIELSRQRIMSLETVGEDADITEEEEDTDIT